MSGWALIVVVVAAALVVACACLVLLYAELRKLKAQQRAMLEVGEQPDSGLPSVSEHSAEHSDYRSLERTFQVLSDAVIQTDAQGNVVRMNPAAERMTGWDTDEARGRSLSQVARLEEPPLTTSLIGGMLQVMSIISREGARIPVVHRRSIIVDEDKSVIGTVLIMRDVSREQRTLEELHSSRRNFQEVIRKTPYGVAIFRDGQFVYVNPQWANSLAYESSEDLVGKHVVDILHSSEQGEAAYKFFEGRSGFMEVVTAQLRTLHETGAPPPPKEFRFMRLDGGVAVLEVSPMQVIRFDGMPACLVVARDVTDLKKMQTQLMVADRMVSVGTLAAGVAHEINNPLAYVIANLDYIERKLGDLQEVLEEDDHEELKEVIGEASQGAERVRVIVRDLKTFSRSDDDRREALEVGGVLESAIKLAWTEIRHRAQLVRDYGEDVPRVEANEARLGQVFLNLIINAAQALPEGDASRHEIRLSTRTRPDGWVCVSVQDNGIGIPSEDIQRVFDPFFTSKPVGVGTGLGLSICHNIITSLGGHISVDTVRGEGTTFHIVLPPAEEVPEVEVFAAVPSIVETGPCGRLLVVDDDIRVGRVLRRALKRHDVVLVQSGREAIELCNDTEFDLILCDLMMPEITGMDLHAELLMSDPELAERMIFITGGAFTPRARQFLDEVHNPRVEKPFDLAALNLLVRERLTKLSSSKAA